jgi:hypothetical protein
VNRDLLFLYWSWEGNTLARVVVEQHPVHFEHGESIQYLVFCLTRVRGREGGKKKAVGNGTYCNVHGRCLLDLATEL